jgi:hypothetical protein
VVYFSVAVNDDGGGNGPTIAESEGGASIAVYCNGDDPIFLSSTNPESPDTCAEYDKNSPIVVTWSTAMDGATLSGNVTLTDGNGDPAGGGVSNLGLVENMEQTMLFGLSAGDLGVGSYVLTFIGADTDATPLKDAAGNAYETTTSYYFNVAANDDEGGAGVLDADNPSLALATPDTGNVASSGNRVQYNYSVPGGAGGTYTVAVTLNGTLEDSRVWIAPNGWNGGDPVTDLVADGPIWSNGDAAASSFPASNDDNIDLESCIHASLSAATDYTIQVGYYDDSSTGTFDIEITAGANCPTE